MDGAQCKEFIDIYTITIDITRDRRKRKRNEDNKEANDGDNDNDNGINHFDGKHFYQRRIARTLPLYYLTNLLCVPLMYAGYGYGRYSSPGAYEYIAYVLTAFVATTWFGYSITMNGPSWFVSTICFFYWIFPSLLPKLQRYDTKQKQRWIIYHYWMQIGIAALVFIVCLPFGILAFATATFWPVSRLPLFIMGMLAGLLRSENKSVGVCTYAWEPNVDILSVGLISALAIGAVIENIYHIYTATWLQLIIPWWHLKFIWSLTTDEATQYNTYRVLTTSVMLQLGRISYSLYLIHFPLLQCITWIYYGTQTEPECEYGSSDSCAAQWQQYMDHQLMPSCLIPAHCVASLLISILLTLCVEEPMRKCLRPNTK